ncbi:MAG TPA: hypothetical protein VFI13_05505, partial [Gemmatimonadales bacterium]|nr:hypothetical protein [Gemmatimonadales bacterium]
MIKRLALLLLLLAACSPDRAAPPGPGDPHPGDATHLAGTWALVAHRDGRPDLVGTVRLSPAPDSTAPAHL